MSKGKAILPTPGAPGTFKSVVPLEPITDATPAWVTPVQRGRLPAEAGAPSLAQYGDVSPPPAVDPLADVMKSPPAPMQPMPQITKR